MNTNNENVLEKALELFEEFNEAELLNLCAMILAGMSMDLKKDKQK